MLQPLSSAGKGRGSRTSSLSLRAALERAQSAAHGGAVLGGLRSFRSRRASAQPTAGRPKAGRPEAAWGRLRWAGDRRKDGGFDGRRRLTGQGPTATAEPIDKGCSAAAQHTRARQSHKRHKRPQQGWCSAQARHKRHASSSCSICSAESSLSTSMQ